MPAVKESKLLIEFVNQNSLLPIHLLAMCSDSEDDEDPLVRVLVGFLVEVSLELRHFLFRCRVIELDYFVSNSITAEAFGSNLDVSDAGR